MNKTAFFLVLVMATLVLFAGCTSSRPYGQSGQNDAPPVETDSASAQPEPSAEPPASASEQQADNSIVGQIGQCNGDETCLAAVALEYESSAICAGLTSSYQQHTCYEQLAVKYKNAGYCDGINEYTDTYDHDNCLKAVNAALGSQSAAADTGSDNSVQVETSQTITSEEYSIPEQIGMCRESYSGETDCMIALAVNYELPSLCEGIPGLDQIDCYAQLAIRYNKPVYCQLLYGDYLAACEEIVGRA